jgi:hypothetical protein
VGRAVRVWGEEKGEREDLQDVLGKVKRKDGKEGEKIGARAL